MHELGNALILKSHRRRGTGDPRIKLRSLGVLHQNWGEVKE